MVDYDIKKMKRFYIKSMLSGMLLLCLSVLIFTSMFAVVATVFFINLKVLLALSIAWLLFFREKIESFDNFRWVRFFIFLIPCIYGVVTGIVNGNLGAMREVPLYLFAPIAYAIIFASLAHQSDSLIVIEKVVKATSVVMIAIFSYLYFSSNSELRDFLANTVNFLLQHPQGYIKAHSFQTTALLFLAPAVAVYYYFKPSVFNGLLLTAMVAMLFLSGRRTAIILLVVLFILLGVWSYLRLCSTRHVLKVFLPLVLGCCLFWVMVKYDPLPYDGASFLASISDAFPAISESAGNNTSAISGSVGNSSLDRVEITEKYNKCSFDALFDSGMAPEKIGAALRLNQLVSLYEEIKRSPLFGLGFGYVIDSCIRSETQPWRFELAYAALAMNVGVVGIFFFILNYLFYVYSGFQNCDQRANAYPLIAASIFFVVCSSTNPYLFSVENIWIYFIPYLVALKNATTNSVYSEVNASSDFYQKLDKS